jgi:phage tail tape-measure protein
MPLSSGGAGRLAAALFRHRDSGLDHHFRQLSVGGGGREGGGSSSSASRGGRGGSQVCDFFILII